MKLTVLALVLMGLVAAVCVAILVNASQSQSFAGVSTSSETEVVVATDYLPAMSVVTSSYVTKSMASKKEVPQGYLTSPVQAVGKILAVPIVEGQVLTESCFVTEGTGAQLAAAIPEGMRAVTITLSGQSVTGGLLYPGCVVDVLASFRLSSMQREKGEALSTTLLHGIQVLAVAGDSVVSKKEKETSPLGKPKNPSGRVTVTLMVDSRQAEALQLAVDYGQVSLAIRNPLDKSPVDIDATVLSQGRLARLGSELTPAVLAATETNHLLKQPFDANSPAEQTEGQDTEGPPKLTPTEVKSYEALSAEKPSWLVTVIRGSEVKQQEIECATK